MAEVSKNRYAECEQVVIGQKKDLLLMKSLTRESIKPLLIYITKDSFIKGSIW